MDDSDHERTGTPGPRVPGEDDPNSDFVVAAHPADDDLDVAVGGAQEYLFSAGSGMTEPQRRLLDDHYAPSDVATRRHFAAVLPELRERRPGGEEDASSPPASAAAAAAVAGATAAAAAAAANADVASQTQRVQ